MGRKKQRQQDITWVDDSRNHNAEINSNGDINVNKNNSPTTVEDENKGPLEKFECKHILKAIINLPKLRKILQKIEKNGRCRSCRTSDLSSTVDLDPALKDVSPTEKEKLGLWFCLKCIHQSCGQVHCEKHVKTPHTDFHCLALDTDKWTVWCFECSRNIDPKSKELLTQIIEIFKKWKITANVLPISRKMEVLSVSKVESTIVNKTNENESRPELNYNNNSSSTSSNNNNNNNNNNNSNSNNKFTRIRGLTNLGNTCFLNAVLQCLAQTPYLVKVLQDLQVSDTKCYLPGGKLKISDDKNSKSNNSNGNIDHNDDNNNDNGNEDDEISLPPIEDNLGDCGNFISVLHKTLLELQSSDNHKISTYKPSELLNVLKKNTPQISDGDQHDSHEVLRLMLELIRNEDLQRYQSIIFKKLGLDEKSTMNHLDAKMKLQAKFYGSQVNAKLLGAEPIFHGTLVSTIQCTECQHSLQRCESFLDLSLSLMELEKQTFMPKKNNRYNELPNGTSTAPDNYYVNNEKISKHQLKKEKKAAKKIRKVARNKAHHNNIDNILNGSTLTEILNGETKEEDANDTLNESDTPITSENSSESLETSTNLLNDSSQSEELLPILDIGSDNTNNKTSEINHENGNHFTYSIESCLNQFTATELMSGSNKVHCEACTSASVCTNQKDVTNDEKSAEPSKVYTSSTKQYLISQVPAVLILHLKRFQSRRFSNGFCKINKHVKFPMILDLSSFCKNSKKPTLYSLYGLIEHQGTIHSGHYVAYVKARNKLKPDDSQWNFLLEKRELGQSTNGICEVDNSTNEKINAEGNTTRVEPSLGQWYYASDSKIMEVDEATVLQREAYLLFYERIS